MVAPDLVEVPTIAAEPFRTSRFQVVAGAPMALNMTTINHGDKSILQTKAIYRLRGNTLTYCVGAPGRPRPTLFATSERDGNTLVTLRRAAAER